MSKNPPPGWHTLTPRMFVEDPKGLVNFIKQVFNAKGNYDPNKPSQIRLGDSMLMISGIEFRSTQTACLYVYIDNVDAIYKEAIRLGATSIEQPQLTHYGDWRCIIEDQWHNTWQIAEQQ